MLELAYHDSVVKYNPFGNKAGTGHCQYTVSVGNSCYYASGVNYAMWGHMFKLCSKRAGKDYPAYNLENAKAIASAWKANQYGLGPGDAEHDEALAFTEFGFTFGAVGKADHPVSDCELKKENCGFSEFKWTWFPNVDRAFVPPGAENNEKNTTSIAYRISLRMLSSCRQGIESAKRKQETTRARKPSGIKSPGFVKLSGFYAQFADRLNIAASDGGLDVWIKRVLDPANIRRLENQPRISGFPGVMVDTKLPISILNLESTRPILARIEDFETTAKVNIIWGSGGMG